MIALDNLEFTTRAQMRSVVDVAAEAGAAHLPIMLLAADMVLDLTFLRRRDALLPRHVTGFGKPHLVVLSDSPPGGEGKSYGPTGWRCTPKLRTFMPKIAIVRVGSCLPREYASAAEGAYVSGRALLIECDEAQAGAWEGVTKAWCPTLVIHSPSGEQP